MPICDQGSEFQPDSRDAYKANRGPAALSHLTDDLSRSKCSGVRQVIQMTMGQNTRFTLYVVDANGEAVDLSAAGLTAKFISKDRQGSEALVIDKAATISAGTDGIVTVTMDPDDTVSIEGIYLAQVLVLNASDEILWATNYYLAINPTLDNVLVRAGGGPITLAEVRMMLRDTCPDINILLDDFEFDDSQIVYAMRWPIDEFNETNFPKTNYSGANFKHRFHWLRATCGYLLEIAAQGYMRDHLPYNAGGVAVDDKAKFGQYGARAAQLLAEWRRFVVARKMEMNIEGGYGGVHSAYGYINTNSY